MRTLRTSLPVATLRRFKAFVISAEKLIPAETPTDRVAEFAAFVRQATPLAVAEIRDDLPRLRRRAALAARWWTPHDVLAVGGLSFVENAYTRLMAWALDPATHPPTALLRQKAWLEAISLGDICDGQACTPVTQLVTDDGIPDLVLAYRRGVVVVEAKTGTLEHATPGGLPQTIAYVEAVRERLGLSNPQRVAVVFISPDGVAAANPDARLTTYSGFALALAGVLDGRAVPAPTRAAFSTVFSHFMGCSSGTRTSTRQLIELVLDWSRRRDWKDGATILRHMKPLQAAAAQLRLTEMA